MRRLIIIGVILASTALLVLLTHEGAFSEPPKPQKKSGLMKVKVNVLNGSVDVKDEDGIPGSIVEEKDVLDIPGVEEVGKIYKYEGSNCVVYCSGGWCHQFCW